MKRCSACLIEKTLEEFHRRTRSKDGKHYLCRPCNYAKARAWLSTHPDARRARYLANPTPRKNAELRRRYGLEWGEYEALLFEQGGICAVCGAAPTARRRLDVDHDHATGRVRGLLCLQCNLAVGHTGDSPARLRAIADYLEMDR